MTVKLAIFDCDGTLVDGQASICDAMESACAAAQIAAPHRNDIRRIVGLSLPQALRNLVPDATDHQRNLAAEAYKHAFRACRMEGRLQEPLYDGIAALLDRLKAQGWALAVATGKSDRGLFSCLAMHGLDDYFISLQTADRHPSKPHPAMIDAALEDAKVEAKHAVMIGDTTFDMEMARAAGVRAIGVNWGYHTPAELLAEGADVIATSPTHLGNLLA